MCESWVPPVGAHRIGPGRSPGGSGRGGARPGERDRGRRDAPVTLAQLIGDHDRRVAVCVLAGTRPTDEGQSNEEHNEENDLGSNRMAWPGGCPQLARVAGRLATDT